MSNPQKEEDAGAHPDHKPGVREGKNVVRKFAFATRVGFHPHNPNKQN